MALLLKTEYEIHAEVKVHFTNVSWLLSAVYASPRNAGVLLNYIICPGL